ncbi:MAG: hypothetical protein H6850_01055 [Alphaproteobacteria bacterium]|nr:MAG: hypothetical protein H6850_01055 [Alphaproteobacteria bacterium]
MLFLTYNLLNAGIEHIPAAKEMSRHFDVLAEQLGVDETERTKRVDNHLTLISSGLPADLEIDQITLLAHDIIVDQWAGERGITFGFPKSLADQVLVRHQSETVDFQTFIRFVSITLTDPGEEKLETYQKLSEIFFRTRAE